MSTPFIEDNDQTRARREHLEAIRQLVGNVYPNKFARSRIVAPAHEDTITAIVERFGPLAPKPLAGARPDAAELERVNAELKAYGDVQVAGRLAVPPRVMGKAAFVHLSDGVSRLQIYVRRDDARAIHNDDGAFIEEGWQLFGLLDHGDFIGVDGYLFVTKTGELSIHVRAFQFLVKALLPMPDKLHGISDPEIRQRQRYADLIAGSLKIDKDDTTKDDATNDNATTGDATTGDATTATTERELTPREVFERRSKFISALRRHLEAHGYIEVETPMLTPIASGAAARPFETTHNALGIKLYARIAPELYLKRLLVGGFERVYELNRNFRNEGISSRHNPEFTMLEFYCAYMDVNGMMDFCEELLRKTIKKVLNGETKVSYQPKRQTLPLANLNSVKFQIREKGEANDFDFDFARPIRRLTMKHAVREGWLKTSDLSDDDLNEETFPIDWLDNPRHVRLLYEFRTRKAIYRSMALQSLGAELDAMENENEEAFELEAWRHAEREHLEREDEPSPQETARQIVLLFEDIAEKHLLEPTFITDFPKIVSPLSKASPDNPMVAERFELFIAGMECANGFSELNDPAEQEARFDEQQAQRERGDDEAMLKDVDYLRALAYGMPPAAGIGLGIDRLTMLLTNRRSIRDVILFPHMRPQSRQTEAAEASVQDEPPSGAHQSHVG